MDLQEQLTMKLSNTQRDESGYLSVYFKGWYTVDTLITTASNQNTLLLHTTNDHPVLLQFTGVIHNQHDLRCMVGFEVIAHIDDFPVGTLYVSREYDEQFFMW